jgi:hypothetical protein
MGVHVKHVGTPRLPDIVVIDQPQGCTAPIKKKFKFGSAKFVVANCPTVIVQSQHGVD